MAKSTKKTMGDVYAHIANGKSDKQICAYLRISTASLAAYKANLVRQGYITSY